MDAAPVSHQSDDVQLLARAQAGALAAFDELVLRYQQEVFAVAMRMLGDQDEAKDVSQDVFVRAYQGIHSFKGEAKLSTWLVSITMNLCRNRRRWWARRRRLIAASLDEPVGRARHGLGEEWVGEEGALGHDVADPSPTPAMAAERSEQQQQLMALLLRLDEADREVIVLRDIQGHSYEEIAGMLGCRLGTVKSRLNRARLRLRALLDGRP